MKMRKFILITLLCALVVFGCDDGNNTETHVHEYSATWSSNATQHWHECSCGDKADVADHEWQWQETTPATITTEGEATGTCNTCGATETKPIDKLPSCTCDPKAHLSIDETCTCGGEDCTACTLKIYGTVIEKRSDNVTTGELIPIYKEILVSIEQAEIAAGNIIEGYGDLSGARRNLLFGKIKEFRIVAGANGYVKIGDQYVISINMNSIAGDISDYVDDIAPSLQ